MNIAVALLPRISTGITMCISLGATANAIYGVVRVQEHALGVKMTAFGTVQVYVVAVVAVLEGAHRAYMLLQCVTTRRAARRGVVAMLAWTSVLLEDVYEPRQGASVTP